MAQPLLFNLRPNRVYVAGHNGKAGSAIVRRLAEEGCKILTVSRQTLDLTKTVRHRALARADEA